MEYPIRILHVVGIMDLGGAETLIMNLYRKLDLDKFQFDFIVHTDKEGTYDKEILAKGGRIYHFSRFKGYNICTYIKEWKTFFSIHPEYQIVHGHVRSTASIYLSIAKKYGIKTIAHSHSTASGKGFVALIKNLLQYPIRYIADELLACSDEAGRWLFGKNIGEKEKYHILANGIDTKKFLFNEAKRKEIRDKYKIGEDVLILGTVGRFTDAKNPFFTVALLDELHKTNDDFKMLWIGKGELKARIVEELSKNNLTEHVIFLENVLDVQNYLNAMDVFLFPSKWEGLGISLIEAQVNGLTVLASRTVPKEVKITDSIYFLDIDSNFKEWIDMIVKCMKEKNDRCGIIFDNRYDINCSLSYLTDIYLKLVHEKEGRNKRWLVS